MISLPGGFMDKIAYINNLIKKLKSENISAKDISDGHHTFRELYKQRLILFCTNM